MSGPIGSCSFILHSNFMNIIEFYTWVLGCICHGLEKGELWNSRHFSNLNQFHGKCFVIICSLETTHEHLVSSLLRDKIFCTLVHFYLNQNTMQLIEDKLYKGMIYFYKRFGRETLGGWTVMKNESEVFIICVCVCVFSVEINNIFFNMFFCGVESL